MTSRSEAGFTLLEVLVVLVILSLGVGLIATRIGGAPRGLAVERTVADIAGGLRQARADAIVTNRTTRFAIDLRQRTWNVGGGPPHALPPDLAISVTTVTAETIPGDVVAFRFEPDGSNTGGAVWIGTAPGRIKINVDWLTGRVAVDRSSSFRAGNGA